MNDEAWTALQRALEANGAKQIASTIPRRIVETGMAHGPEHPLRKLVEAAQSTPLPAYLGVTNIALKAVNSWLLTKPARQYRGWWDSKLNLLGGDSENAAGILAEIRALGTMLSNLNEISHVPVQPNTGSGKAADFRLDCEESVYVEVCCLRMNNDEFARQRELDQIEASLRTEGLDAALKSLPETPGAQVSALSSAKWERPGTGNENQRIQRHQVQTIAVRGSDGLPRSFCTSIRDVLPQGPDKGGSVHTVTSRIAGKKKRGQVPVDKPGILWMDCCDPSWSISVQETQSAEVFWRGLNLVTTLGVWHSFYGKKDVTPMMERAVVGFDFKGRQGRCSPQQFDGRFQGENGGYWSAAVLRCTDGLVIFENPHATVKLPFHVLRGLTALEGYNPPMSFHRLFDEGGDGLRQILDNEERRLAYYAQGSI